MFLPASKIIHSNSIFQIPALYYQLNKTPHVDLCKVCSYPYLTYLKLCSRNLDYYVYFLFGIISCILTYSYFRVDIEMIGYPVDMF